MSIAKLRQKVKSKEVTSKKILPTKVDSSSDDLSDFDMETSKPVASDPLEKVKHKQPSLPSVKKTSTKASNKPKKRRLDCS
jgi:hypothetical protein